LSVGAGQGQSRNTVGTFVPTDKTWAQYCRDIKLEKRTAKMLGVSHTTIQDDLRGGKKLPKEEEKSLKINNETTENGNKLPEPETTPLTGEQAVNYGLIKLKSSATWGT
jgi:hypothetical protein